MNINPDSIDDVEIVEPPLQELKQKGSFFKRTCLFGCSFFFIIAIALVVLVRLFLGSAPNNNKEFPKFFPTALIPIYDRDSVEEIYTIPEKYQKRREEIAHLFSNNPIKNQSSTFYFLKQLWKEAQVPPDQYATTIVITWSKLDAEPHFITNYYKNELQKRNFEITTSSDEKNNLSFSFNGHNLNGTFEARPSAYKKSGTDKATLSVTIPYYQQSTNPTNTTEPSFVSTTSLSKPHDQETSLPPL